MRRLVVASNNPAKLRELEALLAPVGFDVVAQSALGIAEAAEPHRTFVENALAKARHASLATGLAALADDSGLCVPALGGAPGVDSAHYAGRGGGRDERDRKNNAKLVEALAAVEDRCAFYVCVLVLLRPGDDPTPVIAEGRWPGRIVLQARGAGGFGYDPHFLLPERGLTAAELSAEEKNRVSHRALAMQALRDRLGRP